MFEDQQHIRQHVFTKPASRILYEIENICRTILFIFQAATATPSSIQSTNSWE
jgi:hypothetical protein